MEFLFLNDVKNVLKEMKKILYIYLGIIVVYLLLIRIYGNNINIDIVKKCLGLDANIKDLQWDSILFYLFSIFMNIYIFLIIFIRNIKQMISDVFLRITSLKYYLIKEFNTFSITIYILLLIYIVVYMMVIPSISFYIFVTLIIKNIVYLLLMQSLFLFVLLIYSINKGVGLLGGIIIVYLIILNSKIININLLFCISLLIILFILNLILYRKVYIKLSENV